MIVAGRILRCVCSFSWRPFVSPFRFRAMLTSKEILSLISPASSYDQQRLPLRVVQCRAQTDSLF